MAAGVYKFKAPNRLLPFGGGAERLLGTTAPPTTSIRYGISAGTGTDGSIQAENTAVRPAAYLLYDTTSAPTWQSIVGVRPSIPSTADLFIAIDCNTTTQLDALMASCPAGRAGKVYWCYKQEPENNNNADGTPVYPDPSVYRTEGARVYAAVDRAKAAGKTYMVKSSCLLPGFGYERTDATHPAPIGLQRDWLIPGIEHIGWSMYASSQNKNGHMVAAKDPVIFPTRASDCANALGLAWGAVASGFAIPTALINDSISIQNRIDWFTSFHANAARLKCTHSLWFNVYWVTAKFEGDYRVETDPGLYAAWKQALLNAGQISTLW